MKQLGLIPQKVKFLKFVKKDILEPYNFFGNFEIIDCSPKRKYTTRCESDKCILICIDKKMYSAILFDIQKYHIILNFYAFKIISIFPVFNNFSSNLLTIFSSFLSSILFSSSSPIEISK